MYNVDLIYKDGTIKRFENMFKFRLSDTRFYCWWNEIKTNTYGYGTAGKTYQYNSSRYTFATLKNIAEVKVEVI